MQNSHRLNGLFLLFLSLMLLGFLLIFPGEALPAAREGLSLWLNTLLPTLLPFLILSSVLMQTGMIRRLLHPLAPFFSVCFGLSSFGGYALIIGLLCGFPVGARIASELYRNHDISHGEAEYLLTFACNASPAFLISYLGTGCLRGQFPFSMIFLPILLADLICMGIFRIIFHRYGKTVRSCQINEGSAGAFTWKPGQPKETSAGAFFCMLRQKKETSSIPAPGVILDVSIMNGFETITRLGGYLLLFSILNAAISHFWPFSGSLLNLLSGMMELTTGLHSLSQSGMPMEQIYLISMAMVSFGGICVAAQTRSCLDPSLSVKPYVIAKLLNMGLTLLISLILLKYV